MDAQFALKCLNKCVNIITTSALGIYTRGRTTKVPGASGGLGANKNSAVLEMEVVVLVVEWWCDPVVVLVVLLSTVAVADSGS